MDIASFGFAVVARASALSTVNELDKPGIAGRLVIDDRLCVIAGDNAYTEEAVDDRQPLIEANTVMVYEGRVDNREDIAAALRRPELAGASDGTVLLAAYEAWGTTLAGRVVGEYSYAVYDRRRRVLAAGQDALGVRRIFYGKDGDRVWITSDLRYLFAHYPGLRPALDGDTLAEYFSGPLTPWSGRTIWRGVRQLKRGNALEQRGAELSERMVWQLNPPTTSAGNVDEVDEQFRKCLFDAVAASLRSPRPILCDVSGGYDSTTVFSIAKILEKRTHGTPVLVPWAFRNQLGNESQFQDLVSQHFNAPIHTIDRLQCLPFQFLDTGAELPSGGFVQAGALTQAVRQLAAGHGIRTRLTGLAADVLFQKGGAPLHLAEWLRAGRVRDWARHVHGYMRTGSHSLWHLLSECTLGSVDLLAGTFRAEPPDWVLPAFVKKVRDRQREYHRLPRMLRSSAREYVYRHTVFQLPYHERMLPDQRFPLVSQPLVEFVLGLDWKYLVAPGESRLLMRRALKGILPEAVRAGGTIAHHNAAVLEGMRVFWPQVQHLLTGERLAEFGVVSPRLFRSAMERMRSGNAGSNRAYSLTALYLETWLATKCG